MEAEETETGFKTEYEQITGDVVSIFEAQEKENGVDTAAAGLHRLINGLNRNRIEELKVIEENRKAENDMLSKILIPPLCEDMTEVKTQPCEDTNKDKAPLYEDNVTTEAPQYDVKPKYKKERRMNNADGSSKDITE